MKLDDLIVEVRDRDLVRKGVIPAKDLDLHYHGKFNNVGKWELTLPAEHPMVKHLQKPGSGIVARNGALDQSSSWAIVFSGPTNAPEKVQTQSDPRGTVTFTGVDDNTLLAERVIYPNTNSATPSGAHYALNASAERTMHWLVYYNASVAAAGIRSNPNFQAPNMTAVGTGLGEVRDRKYRYQNLGEALEELGATNQLGFRCYQVGDKVTFNTWRPRDITKTVRLDPDNGGVIKQRVRTEAPTVTHVIVGGQGDLEDRTISLWSSAASTAAAAAWGRRIEVFKDQRQTDEANAHEKAANELLAEGGDTTITVEAEPNEDSAMLYGRDWRLGDRVGVVVDSEELSALVVGVVLVANETGFRVGIELGSQYRSRPAGAASKSATNLERRLSHLEREGEVPLVDPPQVVDLTPYNTLIRDPGTGLTSNATYDGANGEQLVFTTTSVPLVGGARYRVRLRGMAHGSGSTPLTIVVKAYDNTVNPTNTVGTTVRRYVMGPTSGYGLGFEFSGLWTAPATSASNWRFKVTIFPAADGVATRMGASDPWALEVERVA